MTYKLGDTIEISIPLGRRSLDWDWRQPEPTVKVNLTHEEMVAMANREDFSGLYYGYACAVGTGFIRLETDYVNAEKENT